MWGGCWPGDYCLCKNICHYASAIERAARGLSPAGARTNFIILISYLLNYLLIHLLAYLLTYLLKYLPTYFLACLLTYLLAYLLICLLAYLLNSLITYLF